MCQMVMAQETRRVTRELVAWKSVVRSLLGERAFAAVENVVLARMNDPKLESYA